MSPRTLILRSQNMLPGGSSTDFTVALPSLNLDGPFTLQMVGFQFQDAGTNRFQVEVRVTMGGNRPFMFDSVTGGPSSTIGFVGDTTYPVLSVQPKIYCSDSTGLTTIRVTILGNGLQSLPSNEANSVAVILQLEPV